MPHRALAIVSVLAVVLAVGGCGTAATVAPSASVAQTPVVEQSAVAAAAASSRPSASPAATRVPCPAGGSGNRCLGPIAAGTYTTVRFIPTLTYAVPDGWSNLEDLDGNFLLIPPGYDHAGVDAGTSDFIGVYTSIVLDRPDCVEGPVDGIGRTPQAFAAGIAKRPGIVATTAKPATIGGLQGLVMDLKIDPKWTKACPYSNGLPVVPVIEGQAPSELEHNVMPKQVMRLYLLPYENGTLAIEVEDVSSGTGSHLADYSKVVGQFQFKI
jgi:hypothetical protein